MWSTSLYGGLQRGNAGLKDRGVKKAPFVVLIGANMPSILAEISFVTNPKDANQLQQPEYRQRVAESLYKGVAKYAGGLSGAAAVGVRSGPARSSFVRVIRLKWNNCGWVVSTLTNWRWCSLTFVGAVLVWLDLI